MKRIVCLFLAMIMIMGMVPAFAVTADAASDRNASKDAINILKGSEIFYEEEQSGKIGYNTPTSYPGAKEYLNKITKEEALELMCNYLEDVVDEEINAFTALYNVDLAQREHDALAVHMYRTGNYDVLFETVRVIKTIDSAAERAAMVQTFVESYNHDKSSDEALRPTLHVALAEANMYLYGNYGYNNGSALGYARLDYHGDLEADEVVGYVINDGYALQAVDGSLGWYLYDAKEEELTGAPLTKLTKDHNTKLIVAKQATGDNDPASYTINTSELDDLNVYSYGSEPVQTGTILKNNSKFTVKNEYLDNEGVKWVYGTGTSTKGKKVSGWIKIGKLTSSSQPESKPIATATVRWSLEIHAGATDGGALTLLGTLNKDDVVNIYEIKIEKTETGNKRWGKVYVNGMVGWINLAATYVKDTAGESGSAVGQTGKIANSETVNIRSSAGITADNKIATLKLGTAVTVVETTMVGDAQWGLIEWTTPSNGYTKGWVYMHYVQLDSAPQGGTGNSGAAENVLYTGVVTSNINLNVRKYADVYAPKVKSLPTGTKINIYETAVSKNMKWGRIDKDQWVCLSYVKLTAVEGGSTNNGEATTMTQAVVTVNTLNVLHNYNSNAKIVGTLSKGDIVTILEKNTEATETGTRIWGRISKNGLAGWINLAYVDLKTVTSVGGNTSGSTTGNTTVVEPTAAVISNCLSVNVRKAAGVYSAQITKLNNGTQVVVHEEITYDKAPWARITWNNGANEGWVCMYYVTKAAAGTGSNTNDAGVINGTSSNKISAVGVVNNHYLNVRSGAGTEFAQVGTLAQGQKVTIFEQVVANGMIWGKINYNGTPAYVCMSYITVESSSSSGVGVMGTVARCFSKANVRSAPGTNNAIVGNVLVGSRVEVFEQRLHGTQYWGRIAQGWVCMDYILLDSELPPDTALDATQPTTQATQAPSDEKEDVNTDGEIAFVINAQILQDLDVRNDTNVTSDRVGTINSGMFVDIKAVKNNGAELWGRIDQYATAGWILMTPANVSYAFTRYVAVDEQPVYVDANTGSTVKGSLPINTALYIDKVTTDGENVYAWVESDNSGNGIFGWVPMNKTSEKAVQVMTVYKNGSTVGNDNSALTGKTFSAMDAVDSIGGSRVLFKMESGVTVNVSAVKIENAQVWGKVDYAPMGNDSAEYGYAWINLAKVNYTISGTTVREVEVRSTMDSTTDINDNPNNIITVLSSGTDVNICQLTFDGSGNIWARLNGNFNDTQTNGAFVKIKGASREGISTTYVQTVATP